MKLPRLSFLLPATLLSGLLISCDTTPRERQDIVRTEARNLDSLASRAAADLKTAGHRAAQYDSAARVRNRQPLDPASLNSFTASLLGPYSAVEQLTPATIEPAYKQLLQQVRTRRRGCVRAGASAARSPRRRSNRW